MRTVIVVALIATASLAHADDERVLIPVSVAGSGTYGEHWQTTVAIDNRSEQSISTAGVTFSIDCPIPEGCVDDALWPKSLGSIASPPSPAGLVLRIPETAKDEVFFSARVAAAPRDVELGGSELPIARESEFRASPITLARVPVRAPFPHDLRTHLRIYTLDAGGATVRVRVRDGHLVGPYFDQMFILDQHEPPAAPGYLFVELNDMTDPSLTQSVVTVDIEPQRRSDGTIPRIWAFATAVANGSEEVTVVTSQ